MTLGANITNGTVIRGFNTNKEKLELIENIDLSDFIYFNLRTKSNVKFKCCNKVFQMNIDNLNKNLRRNAGNKLLCPDCSSPVKKKTTNSFNEEVFNLVGNEYTFLGIY